MLQLRLLRRTHEDATACNALYWLHTFLLVVHGYSSGT